MSMKKHGRMTQICRDISSIPREELESLIMEFDRELDERSKRIVILNDALTGVQKKAFKAEVETQNHYLDYIVPPSSLKPSYARNFIGKAVELIRDKGNKDNIESNQKTEIKLTGSFNPYQGASKRIVTLRQRIGEYEQKIVDINDETAQLNQERKKLKAILEKKPIPSITSFRQEKPLIRTKGQKVTLSMKDVIKTVRQMISEMKSNPPLDSLKCVYFLLKGDDPMALEIFSQLYDPNMNVEMINELEDLLNDRNVQLSILQEQFKHLDSRQNALKSAFMALKDRVTDHHGSGEDDIHHLKIRIAELSKMIDSIPSIENEIEQLREKRSLLIKDKEDILKNGGDEISVHYEEMTQKKNELSDEKASLDQVRRQLEEKDQRIRQRYYTIVEEIKRIRDSEQKLKEQLSKIDTEKRDMHQKLSLLSKAGINDPMQVKELAKTIKQGIPLEIESNKDNMIHEYNNKLKKYRDSKKELERLEGMNGNLDTLISNYSGRLNRSKKASTRFFDEEPDF